MLDVLKQKSEYTERLNEDFKHIAAGLGLHIVSVYETKPQSFAHVFKDIVVPKGSAIIGLPPDVEVTLPRDADHGGVCTYDNPSDSDFTDIIRYVKWILRPEADKVVAPLAGNLTLQKSGRSEAETAMILGYGGKTTFNTAYETDLKLLNDLEIRQEDVILRRGLIDVINLEREWCQDARLSKNGEAARYQTPGKINMDQFTWLMTLTHAALLSSLSLVQAKDLITRFVVTLLGHHNQGMIEIALSSNIEGWRSINSVRSIQARANAAWAELEMDGEHPSGSIPSNDEEEVLTFLTWLVQDTKPRFDTTSSDVYCLALVLQRLGIPLLRAAKKAAYPESDYDENQCVVVLYPEIVPNLGRSGPGSARRGMRIPLDNMQECVAPWPGKGDMRTWFEAGLKCGRPLQFTLRSGSEFRRTSKSQLPPPSAIDLRHNGKPNPQTLGELFYEVSAEIESCPRNERRNPEILKYIARTFFPVVTKQLWVALEKIYHTWSSSASSVEVIEGKGYDEILLRDKPFFARLQSFVLGYYYGALFKLMDISQLSIKEAYGSWGWWDCEVLEVVRDIWSSDHRVQPDTNYCDRFALLKAMAYLFAGATRNQISQVDKRAVGVVAKLCLLTASMLGKSTDSSSASRIYLLDIDGSCIPTRGNVVIGGQQPSFLEELIDDAPRRMRATDLESGLEDFTVHIEPDWRVDKNTCLIAYRAGGRMVHRLNPINIDIAMAMETRSRRRPGDIQFQQQSTSQITQTSSTEVHVIPLFRFQGGRVPKVPRSSEQPGYPELPLVIQTRGLPRARACITAMMLESIGWQHYYIFAPPSLNHLKDYDVIYDRHRRPIVLLR